MTKEQLHLKKVLRRRIKYVVEKGSIARLFKKGRNTQLQDDFINLLMPSKIKKLRTREQFDRWLMRIMKKRRWNKYSRNGIMKDRWAYFAKVINIIVYEIVSNRELIPYTDWQRLNKFLHIPLDHSILKKLSKHNSNFHAPRSLKGMSCEDYLKIQERIREIAKKMKYPPIWLEDEWTS